MKYTIFAAALLTALSARAAEFKSDTYKQAADIAVGRAAIIRVYDGTPIVPVIAVKPAPAAPAAAPAVAAAVAAAPAPVAPAAPAKVETIPLPDMEIAVLRQEPAPAETPRGEDQARAVNGAIGALAGLAVGASIGWAVSKALV